VRELANAFVDVSSFQPGAIPEPLDDVETVPEVSTTDRVVLEPRLTSAIVVAPG